MGTRQSRTTGGSDAEKVIAARRLRLLPIAPLTEAESNAMMCRIAAAQKAAGGRTTDPDLPETVPPGAVITRGIKAKRRR